MGESAPPPNVTPPRPGIAAGGTASLIKWTYGLVNRLAMLLDAAFLMGGGLVFWLISEPQQRPLTFLQAGAVSTTTLVCFHFLIRGMRAYRSERYIRIHRAINDVIFGMVAASLPALLIVIAFLPQPMGAANWLIEYVGATMLALLLGRQCARLILYTVRRRGLLRRRVVVVGSGPLSEEIAARLIAEAPRNNYRLVGMFDPATNEFRNYGKNASVRAVDLVSYAQNFGIDMVVLALPWERSTEILTLTQQLQWIAADVIVPFDAGGLRPQIAPRLDFIDGPSIQLMHRPFKGSLGLIKVAEDYIVAVIALILVSPIMLGAAIALKLEGSGPVIFKQPRAGFNRKPFLMLKFRTMTVDPTDDGSRGTRKDDQRITRVGAFLRRSSIDELPQLINVLRGEMSIVGPRPHVPNMLVGGGVYSEVVQQYAARSRIKPGITC